jgi:DNA-binding CsgD family transcriptional regulator
VVLGALLGLLAVAEFAARVTEGSTVPAGLPTAPVTHSGASLPTALLMCAFCLLATVPAGLPRPARAAVAEGTAAVALRPGASGFLLKDVTAERLFEAVRVVAAGDALLAPAVTRRLISEFTRLRPVQDAQPAAELGTLTPRETEVLRLVAEGLSNPEIAQRLVVTEETVKTHVRRMLAELGLRNRTRAVVAAYESGLVVRGRERG